MKLQFIDGDISQLESLELLTKLSQVFIKYHEDKVTLNYSEEDIKMREKKIKQIQNSLAEARAYITNANKNVHFNSEIFL